MFRPISAHFERLACTRTRLEESAHPSLSSRDYLLFSFGWTILFMYGAAFGAVIGLSQEFIECGLDGQFVMPATLFGVLMGAGASWYYLHLLLRAFRDWRESFEFGFKSKYAEFLVFRTPNLASSLISFPMAELLLWMLDQVTPGGLAEFSVTIRIDVTIRVWAWLLILTALICDLWPYFVVSKNDREN